MIKGKCKEVDINVRKYFVLTISDKVLDHFELFFLESKIWFQLERTSHTVYYAFFLIEPFTIL
jgi:hypothetical protein